MYMFLSSNFQLLPINSSTLGSRPGAYLDQPIALPFGLDLWASAAADLKTPIKPIEFLVLFSIVSCSIIECHFVLFSIEFFSVI